MSDWQLYTEMPKWSVWTMYVAGFLSSKIVGSFDSVLRLQMMDLPIPELFCIEPNAIADEK